MEATRAIGRPKEGYYKKVSVKGFERRQARECDFLRLPPLKNGNKLLTGRFVRISAWNNPALLTELLKPGSPSNAIEVVGYLWTLS